MKSKLVSINILNYNTFEKSCICIDSCLKQTYENFQILLIDNASTDDSFHRLKIKYNGKIYFYQTGGNYGYAGGNNKGVDYCKQIGAEYALLLNSDTELVGNELLQEMINVIELNPKCSVVSPTIFDVTKSGLIKHTNDYLYNRLLRYVNVLPKLKKVSKTVEMVSEAHGSALLVNCNRFIEVGGFPEHYFMYCEESTFAKKTLWAGSDILWLKDDKNCILHHHDKTASLDSWREVLMGRNRAIEYYENKNNHNKIWTLVYMLFKIKMFMECMRNNNLNYYKGMKKGEQLMNNKASFEECYLQGINIKDSFKTYDV